MPCSGTIKGDLIGLKREDAVVFEKDYSFSADLPGEPAMDGLALK